MKRLLWSVAIACVLASMPVAGAEREWRFRVFLDDAVVGHHDFVLRGEGAERELRSEARFTVKFLGITAYTYAHDATERWRGGCLEGLDARTDDNGERIRVAATREGDRLIVTDGRAPETLAGCVMTFAYWDAEILRQPRLLNAQTGKYETVRITVLGDEKIRVRGTDVLATRYRISGLANPIDLWYSAQKEWLALESTVRNGRRLRYRLA